MRSITQLMAESEAVPLNRVQVDWLHLLVGDWQVIADLAGSDLALWLPTTDGRFVAAALCRPATAVTVHMDDIVGLYSPDVRAGAIGEAMRAKSIVDTSSVSWAGSYSVGSLYVPVVFDGEAIAVVSCETNLSSPGVGASGDGWTQQAANVMLEMIVEQQFPYESTPNLSGRGVPRVIDGAILIDPEGIVRDTTPNAVSCMKHIGIHGPLLGRCIGEEITEIVRDQHVVEETLAVVVMGRASWLAEIETGQAAVNVRALPLLSGEQRVGAVLLTRDVSEMRRREHELMTKDATIREIHHRVKNNLQTVSALLRMQSRRADSSQVKEALGEAGRRVQTIATVHEALSQNVDEIVHFDDVAQSVLRMAGSVAATDHDARVVVNGEFGEIPADAASALATVLAELVTNSVEHGLADRDGTVIVTARRRGDDLIVTVEDDGVGIEPGSQLSGLGTQIVHMMVSGELHGTIDWDRGETGGTTVTLHLNLALDN